jgi:hypothetical protein
MEFRKPKWEEQPDEGLIHGHEWKIFPLLHRRFLFADVEQFFLYDLFRADGSVDENVFAYSNIHNDERGLVLYHNRFAETAGWTNSGRKDYMSNCRPTSIMPFWIGASSMMSAGVMCMSP